MGAHSDNAHRMTLCQQCVLWLLEAGERWVIPVLPRGTLRKELRARIDRAHARLHSRVHDHHVQK